MAEIPQESPWIEWTGGECPVDSHAVVECRLRHWPTGGDTMLAWEWDWNHDPSDPGLDIIAYRVASPDLATPSGLVREA